MANPLLALLPRSARQALPIIQGGVARGLSSRAITQSILEAGIKISRGRSVLPAMRAIKQLEQQGSNIQFVANRNRINVNRLPPAITYTKARYTYRVRMAGIGLDGKPQSQYLYITTDRDDFTPQMIKDQAMQAYVQNRDYNQLTEVEPILEHGMQRAGISDFNVTSRGDFIINR
tara:strand:- start:1307 stop:1831 length:525 start_codon:yes stop_codon:yes gene_type:complete